METNAIIKTLRDMNNVTYNNDKSINEMIDEIENKLNFADAVLEETGADIDNNEIEHQLGTVWVGDVTITGIDTQNL
jgi:hypothetical protein